MTEGGAGATEASNVAAAVAGGRASTTSIGTHYLRYSSANALVLLAGLVSFPILTRLLDNTQYGILGYYETWVALAVAIAKFGSQHSVLRLYPHGGDALRMQQFATNMVMVPMLTMLAAWTLAVLGLVAVAWLRSAPFPAVFWAAVFLVPLVSFSSLMDIVLQASERSMLLTVTRVCKRWLELAMILGVVVLVERSALAVYAGKLAAVGLVAAFYVLWLKRNFAFAWASVDTTSIRASMTYGVPLVANELAWVLLDSADRVMLRHMTGSFAAVGVYSIGYALAMHVRLFMSSTLLEAFVPVANRLYGEDGNAAAVRALKDRILLPMTYASIGVAALLLAVGEQALLALSGADKAASGPIFVIVGIAFALYPLLSVSYFGLLLHKRSLTVVAATFGAVALNLGLNLWLIPPYGVMGATWAAVISYAALGLANCLLCPDGLLRFPPWRAALLATLSAAVFLAANRGWQSLGVGNAWSDLLFAAACFLPLFVAPAWLLDARLRKAVQDWRRKGSP